MVLIDFDRIAPIYDLLANFVFMGAITRAKKTFIDEAGPGQKVLILGGGTGKELEWLSEGVLVHFVEPSAKMLMKAKKRNTVADVQFFRQRFEHLQITVDYDIVICNFFLDQFSDDTLHKVLQKIKKVTKPEASLIITDFQHSKLASHLFLEWIMYGFFRYLAGLRRNHLPDFFGSVFEKLGLIMNIKTYFNGFIFSAFLKK